KTPFQSTPPVRGATRVPPYSPSSPSFQSTPPVRGATGYADLARVERGVSIHAPRAGSDVWQPDIYMHPSCFNPRPPCGERRSENSERANSRLFQSTPPVRGATRGVINATLQTSVSIH